MKTKSLQSYLLAGLVVWLPILATYIVLRFIIDLLDGTIGLLPAAYQPERLFGWPLPGLGIILSLSILLVTGVIATNFLGQRLVAWGEAILSRIPFVRSIYNATKQVISTIFATNSQAFRRVLLIEYPRKGLWTIAFQTGAANTELTRHCPEEAISVFIPTAPNPTSGFILIVPQKDLIELNLSVDEALKFVISLGVMQPSFTALEQKTV